MKSIRCPSPRHGRPLQFDNHSDVINAAYIRKTKREGDRLILEVVGQTEPINLDEVLK